MVSATPLCPKKSRSTPRIAIRTPLYSPTSPSFLATWANVPTMVDGAPGPRVCKRTWRYLRVIDQHSGRRAKEKANSEKDTRVEFTRQEADIYLDYTRFQMSAPSIYASAKELSLTKIQWVGYACSEAGS